jgi:hypothetical protein
MLTDAKLSAYREPALNLHLLILSILLAAFAGPARQVSIFILLITFLSAVTLVVWRCYRRDYACPRRIGRRI